MTALVVALIVGCTQSPDPPTGSSTATDSQPGDTALIGLVPDDLDLDALVVEEMATVVRVSWSAVYPGRVGYDVGAGAYSLAGRLAGDRYEAWLVGCAQDQDLDFWLDGQDGDGVFTTETQRIHTGSLPASSLGMAQDTRVADELAEGLVLLGWRAGEEGSGVSLVDRNGELVWNWLVPETVTVEAAEWIGHGAWVLYSRGGATRSDSEIVFVRPDGEITERFEAIGAHHDLAVLPDGDVAWIQAVLREVDGYGDVVGDLLMRTTPEGEHTVLLDSFETWEVSRGVMWGTPYYNDGEDWTHANGLYARASDGSLLLSLAGLNMVAEVDGDTGEINWTVLGSQVTPSDAAFALQHSPSWTPDGTLLIFANESHQREFSWVGEYTFHGEDGLQEIWSAGLDEELHTAALGHAARHADGNTLVAYGTIGVVREFSPSGSVLREISYDASVNLTELDVAVATP